jgi:ribonuclease-3
MPSAAPKLEDLQERIGIAFRDPDLLLEALTHSSFANENPQLSPRDNERLEYLGDAVLQLISAEYLYKVRPDAEEGEMTQVRSAMVNTNTLASLSEELGLGNYLYLGKGIARGGGRNLRSLLANAFEALLGAIFLDAGYDAAFHYCLERFKTLPEAVQDENHKGRLQQVVQERFGVTPYYDAVGARGAGGRMREYTAVVYAGGDPLGTGHGRSKQAAEQSAAKDALAKLLNEGAQRHSRRSRKRGRPEEEAAAQAGAEQLAVEAAAAEPAPAEPAVVVPVEAAAVEIATAAAQSEAAAPVQEPPPAPKPRRSRSRSRAASTPPPEAQPPAAEMVAPAAKTPVPVAEMVAPAAETPAPAAEMPAPAAAAEMSATVVAETPAAPAAETAAAPAAEMPTAPAEQPDPQPIVVGRQFGEPVEAEPPPEPAPAPKRRTRRKATSASAPAPVEAEAERPAVERHAAAQDGTRDHGAAEPVPAAAEPVPEPSAAPEPVRSRQFGEPID